MEQILYKKQYLVREFYPILKNGFRTMNHLRKSRKNNLLSAEFVKRIMLAVTEVNGCEVCSYAHTKSALEMGMSQTEIQEILSGEKMIILKKKVKRFYSRNTMPIQKAILLRRPGKKSKLIMGERKLWGF